MSRWSIRQKLRAAFALLAALVLLMALMAVTSLRQESQGFARFANEDVVRELLIDEIMNAANARAIAARNMVLTTSAQSLDKEHARAVAAHQRVQTMHRKLAERIAGDADVSTEERQAYERLRKIEAEYAPVALRIVAAAHQGNKAQATEDMNLNCYPLLDQLIEAAGDYRALGERLTQAQVQHEQATARQQLVLMLAISAVVAGSAIALAWWLPGHILDPIAEAIHVAEVTARGDLTRSIQVLRRDEAGQLLSAMQAMNRSLSEIVHRVRDASDSITTGSTEIAVGNQDLSHRTELQASNLEQASATMHEMLHSVEGSTGTANEASRLANAASEAARAGGQVVDEVVSTMTQISQSSRKISEIIATIDGIAFQTNILALNAAVEAARAGEQGRGFAVVAGEVRQLAQRSAEAAREIRGLITDSVERVEVGGQLVSQAGERIHAVVDQVAQVATLMAEIREASSSQHEGFARISATVSTLDSATQQNAALVQQSAAAADSLNQQATNLRDAVAVFRV